MSDTLEQLRNERPARTSRPGLCECGNENEVDLYVQIRDRAGEGRAKGQALRTRSRAMCADCAVKAVDQLAP